MCSSWLDGTNDVVYICREGKNEELRHSLRSVEQNFPHRFVIIYGGKPDDTEPDVYHRVKQEGATKWERVRNTLKLVCQNDGITPDFWLFNDDFFVMEPVASPTNYYDGTLEERIQELEAATFGKPSPYTKQLRHLVATLKAAGIEQPLNYAHHTPMLINRQKMLETLEQYPDEPMFRALYGNINHIGGIEMPDVKFMGIRKPKNISPFVSTSDESWRSEQIGFTIRNKFKNKCIWEV